MLTVGKKIEELRKIKKISQIELAEKIDITITGYQKNIYRDDMKLSVLKKIADVFEVNILTFFTDTNLNESANTTKYKHLETENNNLKTELLKCREAVINLMQERLQR